jgi:tRNA 2-thiouridine synthesizing protein C
MSETTDSIEQEEEVGVTKKFTFVNRKAPYGTIYALEGLELVLISAAFDQDVSMVFVDDGVYQLVKKQNTDGIEVKNFSPTYRALDDYDINKLYADADSLRERGLTPDDFVVPVEVLSAQDMAALMETQDIVISF